LLHLNPEWFTFSGTGGTGLTGWKRSLPEMQQQGRRQVWKTNGH